MEKVLKSQLPDGKFQNTTPDRSNAMRAVRGKDNRTTERRLRLAMVRGKIRGWKVHPSGVTGHPDFFFPAVPGIAVFVDGCFWHGCPECGHLPRTNSSFWTLKLRRNQERDKRTDDELYRQGVRVLRFWEHDLSENLKGCLTRIAAALEEVESTGCRLIAFGEGSAFLRREAWRLWWDFTRDFRLRTEELRREHRVAGREVSGLEREA